MVVARIFNFVDILYSHFLRLLRHRCRPANQPINAFDDDDAATPTNQSSAPISRNWFRIPALLGFFLLFPGTFESLKMFRIFCIFRIFLGTFEGHGVGEWEQKSSESRDF